MYNKHTEYEERMSDISLGKKTFTYFNRMCDQIFHLNLSWMLVLQFQ